MRQWTVDDVMTTKAVTVTPDTPYRRVVDLLCVASVQRCPRC
jgi:CBS domain-containing protein